VGHRMILFKSLNQRSDTRYSGATGPSQPITTLWQSLLEPFCYRGWWKSAVIWSFLLFFPRTMGYGMLMLPGLWLWNARRLMRRYWGLPPIFAGEMISLGMPALMSWMFLYIAPTIMLVMPFAMRMFPWFNGLFAVFPMICLPTLLWCVGALRCVMEGSARPIIQVSQNIRLLIAHPIATIRFTLEMIFLCGFTGAYFAGMLALLGIVYRSSTQSLVISPALAGLACLITAAPVIALIFAYSPSYLMARFAHDLELRLGKPKETTAGIIFDLPRHTMKNGLIPDSYVFGHKRPSIFSSGILQKQIKIKLRGMADESPQLREKAG
jgi:hypothetical protein